jgi:TAT (twin-arginine translocation) pathway signal sequence
MRHRKFSRRDVLKASAVVAAGAVFPEPLKAAAAEPTPISPAMIQAARKEGMVAFYTGATPGLLVMGAYSHSREILLGGATLHILKNARHGPFSWRISPRPGMGNARPLVEERLPGAGSITPSFNPGHGVAPPQHSACFAGIIRSRPNVA